MRPIRLYTDKKYIPEGHYPCTLVAPLWRETSSTSGAYGQYYKAAASLFELSGPEYADFALLPHSYAPDISHDSAESLIQKASAYKLQTLIFFSSDSDHPLPHPNHLCLRTSLDKKHRFKHEYAAPALVEDPIDAYYSGKMPVRIKGDKPMVSFCGTIDQLTQNNAFAQFFEQFRRRFNAQFVKSQTLKSLGIRLTKHEGRYIGRAIRKRTLRAFNNTDLVDTHFILRKQYFNGLDHLPHSHPKNVQSHREFIQNIVDSDYVLCPRGTGNYSIRLYETLACGRIPIIIDTDIVLPFEDRVDWKAHSIWVSPGDIDYLPQIVREFHNSLTNNEFEALQTKCRKLWEDYLSPLGYFTHLNKQLHEHLENNCTEEHQAS